jgi:hypothetical protein
MMAGHLMIDSQYKFSSRKGKKKRTRRERKVSRKYNTVYYHLPIKNTSRKNRVGESMSTV